MKLHLPLGLRRAALAVMMVAAAVPASAAVIDITTDQTGDQTLAADDVLNVSAVLTGNVTTAGNNEVNILQGGAVEGNVTLTASTLNTADTALSGTTGTPAVVSLQTGAVANTVNLQGTAPADVAETDAGPWMQLRADDTTNDSVLNIGQEQVVRLSAVGGAGNVDVQGSGATLMVGSGTGMDLTGDILLQEGTAEDITIATTPAAGQYGLTGGDNQLGTDGTLVVGPGSHVLQLNSNEQKNISAAATATAPAGQLTVEVAAGEQTMSGEVNSEGVLAKMGEGTLVLSHEDATVAKNISTLLAEEGNVLVSGNNFNFDTITANNESTVSLSGEMTADATSTLVKDGLSSLVVEGADKSAYMAAIDLQEGSLAVNTALGSAVTMSAGTTVSGNGSIGSVAVANGSTGTTLVVGSSTATDYTTLTLGTLELNSGSTVVMDVNADGQQDTLVVTQAANLQGSSLQLNVSGNETELLNRGDILLVQADDVTGTFSMEIDSNLDGLNARTENTEEGVVLTLSRNYRSVSGNANQNAVARALASAEDAGTATGSLATVLDSLRYTTSSGETLSALNSLGGMGLTTVMSSLLDGGLVHNRNLRNMMGRNNATRQSMLDPKSGQMCYTGAWKPGMSVWLSPFTSFSRRGSASSAPGFDRDSWGGMLGAEYSMNENLLLGLAAGYERSRITDVSQFRDRTDNYYIDLYAGYRYRGWYTRAGIGIGLHDMDHKRSVSIGGDRPFSGTAKSSPDAITFNAFYELSYDFRIAERTTLAPLFTVDSMAGWVDSYSESGLGSAGLNVGSQDAWGVLFGLGARLTHRFTAFTNEAPATVMLEALVTLDAGDQGSTVNARFQGGGNRFHLDYAEPDRCGGLVGMGLDIPMSRHWSMFGGANFEFRGGSREFNANVGMRYSF